MYPITNPAMTAPIMIAIIISRELFPPADASPGCAVGDIHIPGVGDTGIFDVGVIEALVVGVTDVPEVWAVVPLGVAVAVGVAVGAAVGVGVAGACTPKYTFATSVPSCLTEYTAEGRPDVLMLAIKVPSPPTLCD